MKNSLILIIKPIILLNFSITSITTRFSSISNKKPIPNRKPTAAGNTDHAPFSSSISMAGMSSDQTEAATITPDAKPSKDFCTRSGMSFFIKNTKAEPSIVPSKGISNPIAIVGINKERG